MAEDRNILIEDHEGNRYYPHTKDTNVIGVNGQTVASQLADIAKTRNGILINGNLDVWQRMLTLTNPSSEYGIFVADRWYNALVPDGGVLPTSVTLSRQLAGNLPGSIYCYRTAVNGAGSGYGAGARHTILQRVEGGTVALAGAGKKVTMSLYARSNISGKRIGVNLHQGYGTGGSPYENIFGTNFTLTSDWKKYTFTWETNTLLGKTITADNFLEFQIWTMWGDGYKERFDATTAETFRGSGYIDIAQVQVDVGSNALPFQFRSISEEINLCQRYFEKSYNLDTPVGQLGAPGGRVSWASGGGNYASTPIHFNTRKRAVPSIVVYSPSTGNPWVIENASKGTDIAAGADVGVGQTGFSLSVSNVQTAQSELLRAHWSAEAEL